MALSPHVSCDVTATNYNPHVWSVWACLCKHLCHINETSLGSCQALAQHSAVGFGSETVGILERGVPRQRRCCVLLLPMPMPMPIVCRFPYCRCHSAAADPAALTRTPTCPCARATDWHVRLYAYACFSHDRRSPVTNRNSSIPRSSGACFDRQRNTRYCCFCCRCRC